MGGSYLRSLSQAHSEKILKVFSDHQHLYPHQPLRVAIERAGEVVGFCPGAADQALRWLAVDSSQSIGRLRRTELMQLAHSIERFWQQALAQQATAEPAQPA